MNKFEEKMFENELKGIIFSYSEKDNVEITKKSMKTNYKELAIQLKLLKILKENELPKEEIKQELIKPIYTDEDKEFLKQAIANNELTIADLTFDEAIMVGFTGEDYRRAQRKVASEINLSKKEKEEFDYKISNMNSPTPNIINTIYKQIKKK